MAKPKKPINVPLEVAWVGASTAYVTWYADPTCKRVQRTLATCHYEAWERALPARILTIRLHGYDPRIGPSSSRWQNLGYLYAWTDEEMEEALSKGIDPLDLASEMVKGRTFFPRR